MTPTPPLRKLPDQNPGQAKTLLMLGGVEYENGQWFSPDAVREYIAEALSQRGETCASASVAGLKVVIDETMRPDEMKLAQPATQCPLTECQCRPRCERCIAMDAKAMQPSPATERAGLVDSCKKLVDNMRPWVDDAIQHHSEYVPVHHKTLATMLDNLEALAAQPATAPAQQPSKAVCQKCKVDRLKEPCPNLHNCGFGIAAQQTKEPTLSLKPHEAANLSPGSLRLLQSAAKGVIERIKTQQASAAPAHARVAGAADSDA